MQSEIEGPYLEAGSAVNGRRAPVATQGYSSLRDAAAALDIEPWRMARLGRYLHIMPMDPVVPTAELERIRQQASSEDRYSAIRTWLLDACRRGGIPYGK